MAFSGVHVACGFAGAKGYLQTVQSLMTNLAWSETYGTNGSNGASQNKAPAETAELGAPIFRITPTIDVWVTIGPNPQDPADGASKRICVLASGGDYDIGAKQGDRIWIAAA